MNPPDFVQFFFGCPGTPGPLDSVNNLVPGLLLQDVNDLRRDDGSMRCYLEACCSIFAQESLRVTVRLKTSRSALLSLLSTQK